MTTPFYSEQCTTGSGVSARADLGITTAVGHYHWLTALIDEDVIHLVKVPAGATILDVICSITPTTDQTDGRWAVGDNVAATDAAQERFITGATSGNSSTGGTTRLNVPTGLGYKYTVDAMISFHVTTVPGVTAVTTGTVSLTVLYTMDA